MTVAAARRVRWKRSHIRQQAAAPPTPPDTQPPRPPCSSSRPPCSSPWRRHWASTPCSGPSCGVVPFWCGVVSCSAAGRARRTASASPPAAALGAGAARVPQRLGGHFGRAKQGSPVHRLALCVGQDCDVTEYVCTCQTCQRTKAGHGPRGLLHPLPLPSRRGGMFGTDWIAGLPTTARGFYSDMIQNHVDLLSGKVHAVPTRATARRRQLQRRSFASCVSAPATASLTCWRWITTPRSRATCSGPSPGAWARASSESAWRTATVAQHHHQGQGGSGQRRHR
jgi:hypothetical protein